MADQWAQFADAPTAAEGDQWAQFPDAQSGGSAQPESFLHSLGRGAGLVGRAVVQGVTALPLMAMDAGVAGRNLVERAIGNPGNYQPPSQEFNQALTQIGVPEPHGAVEKAGSLAIGVAAGSILPAPEVADQAPAAFVKQSPTAARDATLQASQQAGYVVPPATTNPSGLNKVLETIGGKVATAQDAALKNQPVTTALAKRALGLSEDAPLTQEAISATRAAAGNAYKAIRNVGDFSLDKTATSTLDALAGKYTSSKLAEAIGGGNDIPKIVQAIKDEPLNGNTAVDAIGLLRDKATSAYAAGDQAVGKAYRSIADSLEGLIERHLSSSDNPDLLDKFQNARELIAKTYSVQKAFNPSTGDVSGIKLAAQLTKGKPLTGELKLAAQFAQAFPKAARDILDSGSVRNTDLIVGGGTAALSQKYQYLLYPFIRQAARAGMLSRVGQNLATQSAASIPSAAVMGAVPAGQALVSQ